MKKMNIEDKARIVYYTLLGFIILWVILTLLSSANAMKNTQRTATATPEAITESDTTENEPDTLTDWECITKALINVESGNRDSVKNGNCVGCLQITPIYVKQANKLQDSVEYTLEDRYSRAKSIEMFNIVQKHYNKDLRPEKAPKLHNPTAGKWYTDKVMKEYNNIKKASR